MGLDFRAIAAEIEEGADPQSNALAKARDVAGRVQPSSSDVVLGVDTVVRLDGHVLGKPANEDEAREMVAALAGRTHAVESAMALIASGEEHQVSDTTAVTFRELPTETVEWYVGTGEWHGRAGGYAIQGRGAALVTRIEGDYTNVVGLPVARVLDLLESSGAEPWAGGLSTRG